LYLYLYLCLLDSARRFAAEDPEMAVYFVEYFGVLLSRRDEAGSAARARFAGARGL
jgi:hypothetical protein